MAGQVRDGRVVPQQVVIVDVHHAQLTQHPHQAGVLVCDAENELKAFAFVCQLQADAAIRGGRQCEKGRLGAQVLGQLADVAHRAARTVVQHGEHDGKPCLHDACCVNRHAICLGGVFAHKGHHGAFVARVQATQCFHRGFFAGALAVAKTHATGVQHEGVEQVQVAPPSLSGALAEIVFLAVAFAEVFGVEQAHLRQAVAADVHTKAHARGHIDHHAGVGLGTQGIEPGGVIAGR